MKNELDMFAFLELFCHKNGGDECIEEFGTVLKKIGLPVTFEGKSNIVIKKISHNKETTINIELDYVNSDKGKDLLRCQHRKKSNEEDKSDVPQRARRKHVDEIREVIFNKLVHNKFAVIYKLADILGDYNANNPDDSKEKSHDNKDNPDNSKNKSQDNEYNPLNSEQRSFIEKFKDNGFTNGKDIRNFNILLDSEYDKDNYDYVVAAWIFAFLCFPMDKDKVNKYDREKLLKKVLEDKKLFSNNVHNTETKTIIIAGNKMPKINKINIGRDDILIDIKDKIAANISVLIYGIGGIGKTYICRKLFYDYLNTSSSEIKYLLWIQYNTDFETSLITAFADENINPELLTNNSAIFAMVSGIKNEPQHNEKIKSIENLLDQLGNSLLIIIDNLKGISAANLKWLQSRNCRMIISSRQKIDELESIHIKGPSMNYCCELYKNNCDTNENAKYTEEENEYIKQIVGLAGHHTLSVKLIARTQYNSLDISNAKDMLEQLKATGFSLSNISDTIESDGENLTIIEHLSKVFDISTIMNNESQMRIMRCFSLLEPNTPIKGKTIKCWFDLKSSHDINTLVSSGWINRETNNCFSIHPVISDVIRYRYPPDYSYSASFIDSIINSTPHENRSISDVKEFVEIGLHCCSLADKFIEIRDENIFPLLLHALAYSNYFPYHNTKTNNYFSQLLEVIESNNDGSEAGQREYLMGIVFKLNNDDTQAIELFKKAIMLSNENSEIKPDSYIELGKIYLELSDYPQALINTEMAMSLLKQTTDENNELINSCNKLKDEIRFSSGQNFDELFDIDFYKKQNVKNSNNSDITYDPINEKKLLDKIIEGNEPLAQFPAFYTNNMFEIASEYIREGKINESVQILNESLEVLKQRFNAPFGCILKTYLILSIAYMHQENYTELNNCYCKLISFYNKGLINLNDKSYSVAYYCLVIFRVLIYLISHKIEENDICSEAGLKLLLEIINITDNFYSEYAPKYAIIIYNTIAEIYYRLKDYNNALIYYEKLIILQNQILGENHPDTQNTSQRIKKINDLIENQIPE
ncbi:tetratricopeptide repeat protein [Ruminococcus sp.]|uniref:tetratricopeptide repeat protein n=1 Tax=Ruminococcus sp. TaxID=41978 RepID=UPI0025D81BB1|nr:tetratricopeptide repeat protein [Ruminococcus sp.]